MIYKTINDIEKETGVPASTVRLFLDRNGYFGEMRRNNQNKLVKFYEVDDGFKHSFADWLHSRIEKYILQIEEVKDWIIE